MYNAPPSGLNSSIAKPASTNSIVRVGQLSSQNPIGQPVTAETAWFDSTKATFFCLDTVSTFPLGNTTTVFRYSYVTIRQRTTFPHS